MHEEVFKQQNRQFVLPQKALIVFPDFIGDSILLTAFLRNFRYNLPPHSVVHICANKAIADMLEGNPYIDTVFMKNKVRNIPEFLDNQGYDTAIILDFSLAWSFHIFKSNINQKVITDMKRANLRIHKFLGSFFSHVLSNTTMKDKTPQIEVYLGYLSQLGLKVFDRYLEVKVDFEDMNVAKKLIKNTQKRKVFLHLGASIYSKRWPVEYWQEVIEYLENDEIYIIGAQNPPEFLVAENVVNLCSKTSIKQTIALLYNADILITTDSAPAHLAAVAKVPDIIVLYGPTNYHQWRPYAPNSNVFQLHANVSCNPCNLRICKGLKCLKELKPQMVKAVIDKIKVAH